MAGEQNLRLIANLLYTNLKVYTVEYFLPEIRFIFYTNNLKNSFLFFLTKLELSGFVLDRPFMTRLRLSRFVKQPT